MRRPNLWLLSLLLLTDCTLLDAIGVAPPQTEAAWHTIQPHAAIESASQEIIVAKKGHFSFQEAGLIP
jgi:hypothetical protein